MYAVCLYQLTTAVKGDVALIKPETSNDRKSLEGSSMQSRKRLRLNALMLAMLFLLVVGTTLAWLTDDVKTANGELKMGAVKVNTFVFPLKDDGTEPPYTDPEIKLPGFNRFNGFVFDRTNKWSKDISNPRPAIFEENWYPAKYSAKLIRIVNTGTVTARVKICVNEIDDDGLSEVLWYALVPVIPGANNKLVTPVGYDTTNIKRVRMDELEKDIKGIGVFKLLTGEMRQYVLIYGMCPGTGNSYQGSYFAADFGVVAIQDSNRAQKKIFGN